MTTALFITDKLSTSKANAYQSALKSWDLFDNLLICSDLISAFDLLGQWPVDAVLYAWQETSSGSLLEFLQKTRQQDGSPELPVLVMTEGNQTDVSIAALEHGAADCLDWQLSPAECQIRIRTHLKRGERLSKLRRENQLLAQMALTDKLTDLYNRAYFDTVLENEMARSERSGRPMSLLMIDLDNFKQINDTFGHQVGDSILQMVGRTIKSTCRCADVACRYGGEEFALILPETNASAAFALAERIRRNLLEVTAIAAGERIKVSATIGLSCSRHPDLIDARGLLRQADTALYAGKRNGRNRTETFGWPGREEEGPAPGFSALLHAGYGYS